jgi:hypothetical protein
MGPFARRFSALKRGRLLRKSLLVNSAPTSIVPVMEPHQTQYL